MALLMKIFEFNPFCENTYIIYDEASREAIVVDPGMMDSREFQCFDRFVEENQLVIKHLVNTHIHIDHVAGDNHVMERYGVSLSASEDDAFLSYRIVQQAEMFHLRGDFAEVVISKAISDHDSLIVGGIRLEVISVPGHSPGSIALYCPEGKWVIVGDALFYRSVGRTDLPGGNYGQLISSIQRRLLTLPSETVVYPGHGRQTTVGEEQRFNPYL